MAHCRRVMSESWTREDVEATVADFFHMLTMALAGQQYSKTDHRRKLIRLLKNRSESAIDRARRAHHCDGALRQQGASETAARMHHPLIGKACFDYAVSELALLRWDKNRLILDEVAPGFSPREVIELTEMEITAAPDVKVME